jgi:hypothetical protein
MDLNNPIPQEWTSYVTQSPVGLEIVPAHLYDTLTYTDNTTTELRFFQQTNVALDISNLKQAGMLPNPQSFLIQSIRFFVRNQLQTIDTGAAAPTNFASNFNDVILLTNTGIAQLNIGTKQYGPWPLWSLPSGAMVTGVLAQAGAEAANLTQLYGQLQGPMYPLFPNLMIAPLQNFELLLRWPSGAVDLSGNQVIEMVMDGQLARAVQ